MVRTRDILFPYLKKKEKKAPKPCRHQLQMQDVSNDNPAPKPPADGPSADQTLLVPSAAPSPMSSRPTSSHSDTSSVPDEQAAQFAGPCPQCKQEKHEQRVYRWKLIGGLLLPYFLASIDLTIVAASLSFIASYFNKLDQLNWIVVAYSLTSTAFIPAFGQLADVFGRHSVLQFAVFFMLIGSVLCTAAQTWAMLLLGRALQGVGAAGINNLIEIILSDKVSLKDNARNTTIFAFIGGLAFSAGPLIGGHLTNINWRYAFAVSIPIAAISHVTIFFLLRKELVGGSHFTKGSRRHTFLPGLATVDVGGTTLFISGIGLIIIGTSWGGATYPWTALEVLIPLIVGSVLFVLFFVYEYFLAPGRVLARVFPQQTPMIPSSLFEKRDATVLVIVEFATGAAMFSVFYFIGIYFTLVEEYSASKSGVQLLYYLPGIGIGIYSAMYMCNVRPAQTWLPLSLGTYIEAVGVGLITWAVSTRKISLVNAMMVVSGAGSGLRLMPGPLHAAGIFPDKIAAAMSIMQFAHPLGGTLALTIMGSVFNNKMADVFRPEITGDTKGFDVHSSQSLDAILDLPAEMQEYIRSLGKDAVMWAFISITPIMLISLVAVLLLGNVWIKSKKAKQVTKRVRRAGTHDEGITSSEVVDTSYAWALITGTVEEKKYISTPLSKAEKERQAQAIFEEKSRVRAARKNNHGYSSSYPDVESTPFPTHNV